MRRNTSWSALLLAAGVALAPTGRSGTIGKLTGRRGDRPRTCCNSRPPRSSAARWAWTSSKTRPTRSRLATRGWTWSAASTPPSNSSCSARPIRSATS